MPWLSPSIHFFVPGSIWRPRIHQSCGCIRLGSRSDGLWDGLLGAIYPGPLAGCTILQHVWELYRLLFADTWWWSPYLSSCLLSARPIHALLLLGLMPLHYVRIEIFRKLHQIHIQYLNSMLCRLELRYFELFMSTWSYGRSYHILVRRGMRTRSMMALRSAVCLLEVLIGRRQNRTTCILRDDGGMRGTVSLMLNSRLLGNKISHISWRPRGEEKLLSYAQVRGRRSCVSMEVDGPALQMFCCIQHRLTGSVIVLINTISCKILVSFNQSCRY
jgi:hypothetical protein